ncbi:DUF6389 family protein [Rhodovulum sp. DZ06]|uniref:DUF6389 family protein n=1 Tax=Rhodovulum sp. DZ06 TaxID=3425126 RepID=UPI003D3376CB
MIDGGEMDEARYRAALRGILDAHSGAALEKLRGLSRDLPEAARGLSILVHVPQDPEGMFDVAAHLDGPDLHALNKAVAAHRDLFGVRFESGVLVPDVPMFDPFDQAFDVNEVITRVALDWIAALWAAFGGLSRPIPVIAAGVDHHGPETPLRLA